MEIIGIPEIRARIQFALTDWEFSGGERGGRQRRALLYLMQHPEKYFPAGVAVLAGREDFWDKLQRWVEKNEGLGPP